MIYFLLAAFEVGSMLFQGWALKILWGWFIVPAFGIAALSFSGAMGLMIVSSLMTSQYIKRDEEAEVEAITYGLALPVVLLGVGWIVRALG